MPNSGGRTGNRNTIISARLCMWTETHGGLSFDSSTVFKFPNGAKRSPGAAWIGDARWTGLTEQQQERFPPIAPVLSSN